jgi:hypothetical protein
MRCVLLFIAVAFCMMGCEKGTSVSPNLFGKWELRRAYGGFSYRDSIYKAGNGTVYQFNSDSTYKHFTKSQLDGQGVFHIKRYTNPAENTISNYQIFFDNTTYGTPFSMKGTMITIGTTVTDQIASDYQKISN